jgi:hypothetical protein
MNDLKFPFNIEVNKVSDTRYSATFDELKGFGNNVHEALRELSEEVIKKEQLSQDEYMQDYLTNRGNISAAAQLAQKIGEAFRWNWFELNQLEKKSFQIFGNKLSNQDVANQLNTLILFSNCTTRSEHGKIKFKITLGRKAQLDLIEKQIVAHTSTLLQLQTTKDRILLDLKNKSEVKNEPTEESEVNNNVAENITD